MAEFATALGECVVAFFLVTMSLSIH